MLSRRPPSRPERDADARPFCATVPKRASIGYSYAVKPSLSDGLRMTTWFPIAVTLVVAGLVVGLMCTINMLVGPRRPSAIKSEPFECGNPSSGSAWGRFSVRFYLTAILFLLFDVEVIFLYPWAVELRSLGMFGFVEALIFISILAVGLIYAWQRGALDWD
jgi:NADH-quinone oxidoreductase subunit A